MLERILEPEVMDTKEDADEYESIDNASVNEEFVARALELAPVDGTVLDVGTGPGDIAILFARRAPALRIRAIDLGEHMLAIARRRVNEAGLEGRVEIARGDAKSTGLASHSFDMIVSNSLVHHVPEPEMFFAEVMRIAKPLAALFIKDLHRPGSDAEHRQLVDTYARDCTPYQRRLFSDSLRAALTVSEVQSICARQGLANAVVRRCSDRHWCLERAAEPVRSNLG